MLLRVSEPLFAPMREQQRRQQPTPSPMAAFAATMDMLPGVHSLGFCMALLCLQAMFILSAFIRNCVP
jgi:hypothetical protein